MNRIILLPKIISKLEIMGENIKLARLRRKLSVEQVCERANILNETLVNIENGSPNVLFGHYVSVLITLNLVNDIYNIANDDILGRKLQDIELLNNSKNSPN